MSAGKEAALGWKASLSTAVSSGPSWPPEALVELVWQAIKARRLATRQRPERLGEVLHADAAIAGCALSLLPLLRREVQIQCHEKLLLRLLRRLWRRKEALW